MFIKCYICNENTERHYTNNIFTTKTIESHIPIYKFLESFIDTIIDGEDLGDEVACEKCFLKLNEYDLALCTTKRIENEFFQLLNNRNQSKENCLKYSENDNEYEFIHVEDEVSYTIESEDSNDVEKNPEYVDELHKDEPTIEEINEESIYMNDNDKEELEIVEIEEISPNRDEKKGKTSKNKKTNLTRRQKKNLCELCNIYFNNYKELCKHRKDAHNLEERYVCDICGTSYKMRSALKIHIKMHNGENPFKCETCGKSFTQKGALKRHRPIHTGEKSYQCDKCGKQFIHYSSFHMHNLAHDGIRNKKCEICGLSLRSSSHLSRHMRIHTGEKPYSCPKCGQKFAQRYNMTSHLKSYHQGIHRKKRHRCKKCNTFFTTDYQLTKHKEICTNEKVIKYEIIEFDKPNDYEVSNFNVSCS